MAVHLFPAVRVRAGKSCSMCYWGEAFALGPSLNTFDDPRLLASIPAAYTAAAKAQEAYSRAGGSSWRDPLAFVASSMYLKGCDCTYDASLRFSDLLLPHIPSWIPTRRCRCRRCGRFTTDQAGASDLVARDRMLVNAIGKRYAPSVEEWVHAEESSARGPVP